MNVTKLHARFERFLRIDDTYSVSERLRARVVCGVALIFVLLQVVNWVTMYQNYGGLNVQHFISVAACGVLIGLMLSLRWLRSPTVVGIGYSAAILVAVVLATLFANHPAIAGGINSPLLPLMVAGALLLALTSCWQAVAAYCVLASGVLTWLYFRSQGVLADNVAALSTVQTIDLISGMNASQSQRYVQAMVAVWLTSLIGAPFGHKLFCLFDELEDAVVTARRAEMTKGEFLARMSHEVRTPLNGIIAMSDLLLKQDLPESARRQAEIVNSASDQLLGIVNDVLDGERLDAGQMNIVHEPFDLHKVLHDVVELNRLRAERAGLWIGFDWQDGLAKHVIGDAKRWQQVVGNLVSNAVKFTEHGGVRIGARGVAVSGGVRLQVYVQDTGVGIEESAQNRIFERFGQSESGARQGAGGTGLGLAIVAELVALMGGAITLKSDPGRGSVFAVEIVMAVADGPRVANSPAVAPVSTAA